MKDIASVVMLVWPASRELEQLSEKTTSWQELPGAALPFGPRREFTSCSLHGGTGFAVAGGHTDEVDMDGLDLFDSAGPVQPRVCSFARQRLQSSCSTRLPFEMLVTAGLSERIKSVEYRMAQLSAKRATTTSGGGGFGRGTEPPPLPPR